MCSIDSIETIHLPQVKSASSEDSLREIVMEDNVLDCITEAGFMKPLSTLTLAEKYDIVLTITTYLFVKVYYTFTPNMAAILF